MKKVLIVVLICALIMSCVALSGCGSVAGTYKVEKVISGNTTITNGSLTDTQIATFGFNKTIILNEDGTGKLIIEGEETTEEDLLWEKDGDTIEISSYWINAFKKFTCKIKGDTLIEEFDLYGTGIYMERHYVRQ